MQTYRNAIGALTLIPSDGGVFEVSVNGALVHSKQATDRFPEEDAIMRAVEQAIEA